MELCELTKLFIDYYGGSMSDVRCFIGPARINLIGEHTDYQGGLVLPCAIHLRSACLVRPNNSSLVRLRASDLPVLVEAHLDDLAAYREIPWGNYQLGVIYTLLKMGYPVGGMEMLFDETVPHKSGLSSSAAIEVATATAVTSLYPIDDKPTDPVTIAKIAQAAENNYIGVMCGLMDPFASAMGKKDAAILLKTKDLSYRYISAPFRSRDTALIVCDTKKPRSLMTSAYNQRREELAAALQLLTDEKDAFLADYTPEAFEKRAKEIKMEPLLYRRARHVVSENARAAEAAEDLEAGRLEAFGKKMIASHLSLRDDLEVTGEHLDAMFDAMIAQEGVFGARMTGAGFGGCAIAMVLQAHKADFIDKTKAAYESATGITPSLFEAVIDDGAREVDLNQVL